MLSQVFIERPVLAWVISILIMLGGLAAIRTLPVEQYPDIAPPSVNVRANYPGASAETLESSVTQIIEQQLTGIDGLIYFSSSSSANGSATVAVGRAAAGPGGHQVEPGFPADHVGVRRDRSRDQRRCGGLPGLQPAGF